MKSIFDDEVLDALKDGAIEPPGYYVPSAVIRPQNNKYIMFANPLPTLSLDHRTAPPVLYQPKKTSPICTLPAIGKNSYICNKDPDPEVERRLRELPFRHPGSDAAGDFTAHRVFIQRVPASRGKVNFIFSLHIFLQTFNH